MHTLIQFINIYLINHNTKDSYCIGIIAGLRWCFSINSILIIHNSNNLSSEECAGIFEINNGNLCFHDYFLIKNKIICYSILLK